MKIYKDIITNYALYELRQAEMPEGLFSPKYTDEDAYKRHLLGYSMLNKVLQEKKIDGKIQYNRYGKPLINGIDFNISHSGNYVVLVIGNSEIGIDIEYKKERNIELIEKFFTEQEQQFIKSANDPLLAFYQVWTLKEAYLKAVGKGLYKKLSSFTIFPQNGTFVTEHIENCQLHQEVTDEYVLSTVELIRGTI